MCLIRRAHAVPHLHDAALPASHQQLPVGAEGAGGGPVLEAGQGRARLPGGRIVDEHAGGGGDRVVVGVLRAEVDAGDGSDLRTRSHSHNDVLEFPAWLCTEYRRV